MPEENLAFIPDSCESHRDRLPCKIVFTHSSMHSSDALVAGNDADLAVKGVTVKQGYRLIVVDKDGVLVSEFQLTEQALAAPEAFVAALKESVEAIEEAEP